MTISFHCDVCGRETILDNVRPGRKVFCLHCGHKITDCYEENSGTKAGNAEASNQGLGTRDNLKSPSPLPPPVNSDWKTEPYIRINWRRIGYSISCLIRGISNFFTQRCQAIRQGMNENERTKDVELGAKNELNVPPPPVPDSQSPNNSLPFGQVDYRQERINQSFSSTFAQPESEQSNMSSIPDPNQQRIDNSFSKTFADTGAIPVPPPDPNYAQIRKDQSFSKTFRE